MKVGRYLQYTEKSFQQMLAYRIEVFVSFFSTLLWIYLVYAFWSALYLHTSRVEGITLSQMIEYAILSRIIGSFLDIYITYWMPQKIREGSIVFDLARPIDFELYLLFHSLGRTLFGILILGLPAAIISHFLFGIGLPENSLILFWFLLSLLLSYLTIFLLDFLVCLSSFWTTQIRGVGGFERLIIRLCSGAFVPLWFFPEFLKRILILLPFASIYHVPLSIYIGKITGEGVGRIILQQAIWVAALAIAGRLLWRSSHRRLMIHGG